jgi:hypothetical protein
MNDLCMLMKGSWALLQVNSRMLFLLKYSNRYPWRWQRKTFQADQGNMVTHVCFGIFHYCRVWWEKKNEEDIKPTDRDDSRSSDFAYDS